MKCKECDCCHEVILNRWSHEKGNWIKKNVYQCWGVAEPFEIEDINVECTQYPKYRDKKVESKTVVDNIRAMNDEELALFFSEDGWGCHHCSEDERLSDNPFLHGVQGARCDEDCYAHCLEWLHKKM